LASNGARSDPHQGVPAKQAADLLDCLFLAIDITDGLEFRGIRRVPDPPAMEAAFVPFHPIA
jgi:hypothetical protein